MLPVVTPDEMAAIDAAAPEPVEVLVDRAGAAVARQALSLLGGAYGRRVVVVAGTGNNGADGRVAADRLRRRGLRVSVVEAADAPDRLPDADLVIDAAYGTGLRGGYDAPDPGAAPVLAVDIPSGVAGLTGEAQGSPLAAARTVTFAALKPGLLLQPGRSLAGEVTVADIGLDTSGATAGLVERDDVAAWLPGRAVDAHKWHAAVVVVAGAPGMTGAAHLTAAAAQRAGAGMVRLACPGVTDDALRPHEAVGLEIPTAGWDTAVLEATDRARAVVVGPGLGLAAPAAAAIRRVVAEAEVPVVVDCDGLTALGTEAVDVLGRRAVPAVLTPHDGEAERLTGTRPGPDRLGAARSLAASTASIVVLKGPTTIVAHPDGRARFVATGDQRLATAGTGDVLAGTIGALLATGADPFDAAAAGAWLHGRAASHGPAHGLIASDVIDALPAALAEVRR
jgi:ADP-dependent NAD(P)H-hydrate dehydratase / NAD(P)H-hydrate epimerase